MERLTGRTKAGLAYYKKCFEEPCKGMAESDCALCDYHNNTVCERLAAYEDIGVLPEQLHEVSKLYLEKCEEVNKLKAELEGRCNMIIRSQDKKKIFDIAGTTIKINGKNELIGYGNNQPADECELLGGYSTEEKAIKVLDMITEEYGKHLYGQGGQMATADIYIQPFAFIPPKVFQMPSDEEAEV